MHEQRAVIWYRRG